MSVSPTVPAADLVVVGAGIVGLAHAVAAIEAGMTVTVLDRDERAVGASVRNFGHGCSTAQVGEALIFAEAARGTWLRAGKAAGFSVQECGTVVVARAEEEMAALEELRAERGDDVELLDAAGVTRRVPVSMNGMHGGAFLPRDLRVDQRAAASALAAWVASQAGAAVGFSTPVTGIEDGVVHTGRGPVRASKVVVCVGHNLDRLLPEVADRAGLRRCALQMLQVRAPGGRFIEPAVLTGSSLLRYPALARTAGAQSLRQRWERERPEMLDAVVNHMLTQRPAGPGGAGDLVVGDTHAYGRTLEPFSTETLDELLLAQTRELLGVDRLTVVNRWRGVYASADGEFLRERIGRHAVAVSVTSGIGMTTAFGLGASVLATL